MTPQGSATHGSTSDAGARVSEAREDDAATEAAPFDGATCASTSPVGDMVSVAAGSFPMGCATGDTACNDDEKPQHMVSLDAFQIDKTEVTRGAYWACVQAGACHPPQCAWDCSQPDLPAACIERADAQAYCAWAGKRLPTEAEWEMAARGTDGREFPWGSQPPDCTLVNMAGCGDQPRPVGSYPSGASPYGALDMEGNVVEMVADWYDPAFYQTSPGNDPTGPATGTRYVGRGGGYRSQAVWQRASQRDWYDLTDESTPLGFRCAQ